MGIIVFESLLPVVLVIVVGYGLRKTDIVAKNHWQGIDLLCYWLLIPILVLVSLIKMDLRSIDLGSLTKGYLLALITQFIIIWALKKPLSRYLNIKARTFSSIFQTATRWNGFIALGIANGFAGNRGLAIVALIMAITLPIINFVNLVVLMVCCSENKPTIRKTAVNTLKVPLIWGALLGLSLNFTQVVIYEPMMTSLEIVGQAGLGIGLLTVGAGLQIRTVLNTRIAILIGIVAKLLLFPLLVFSSCLIFNVTGIALQMAMLSASVATGLSGYVFARQFGGDANLYATTASLQMVISMVSTPLILWLISDLA